MVKMSQKRLTIVMDLFESGWHTLSTICENNFREDYG